MIERLADGESAIFHQYFDGGCLAWLVTASVSKQSQDIVEVPNPADFEININPKQERDFVRATAWQHQALTIAALWLAAFSGCGEAGRSPDTAQSSSAPRHVDEQPATDDIRHRLDCSLPETHMATVKSHELTGIWLGVADNTAVVIRFIGSESRQPGRAVVEGEWLVHVPGHTIGSGLEFIDDDVAGVVEFKLVFGAPKLATHFVHLSVCGTRGFWSA